MPKNLSKCRHLLIDANNLLCRAHYATQLKDRKGRRTSGIYGVMKMLGPLMRQFQPANVIIAWDRGKCVERLKIYPEYKAQRDLYRKPKEKIEIDRQRKILFKLFDLLPMKQVMVENVEADDVIGFLCERLKGEKVIVSNDKDFLQLIDHNTSVFNANKQAIFNDKNIEKLLGFPIKHYILFKSMVGDSSDNIKGIHGIGEVKARKIIQRGLVSKKKLKISPDEQKILDRNKYLIAIGALLTKDEIRSIKKNYKNQKGKKGKFKSLRKEFIKLGFKSLYMNFYEWSENFKGLRNGKKEKTKGKK